MNYFLKTASLLLLSTIFLTSCSDDKTKMNSEILSLENSLYNKTSMQADSSAANSIIEKYIAFADKFPEDTASANYLFKAGDISAKVGKIDAAITLFERLIDKYPTNHNAPYAIFLQGFIYENQSGEPMKAKPYYEKFLKLYPDHPIAADVTFSLENLGKTPEELMMEFEKKALLDSTDQLSSAQAE